MKFFFLLLLFVTSAYSQTDAELEKLSKEELIQKYKELKKRQLPPDPFADDDMGFGKMFERMQKRFQNFFDDPFYGNLAPGIDPIKGLDMDSSGPQITQKEDDESVTIILNTNNLDKETLKLDIKNGMIQISGKTRVEQKNQTQGAQSFMQYESSFQQSFPVPTDVEADKVEIKNEKDEIRLVFPRKKAGKII